MSAAFCRSASASGLSSALSKSNSTSDDKLISILNPVSVALKPLPCDDRLLPWAERLLPCAERADDADATADACSSAAGAEALDASDAVWGITVVLAAEACACGSAGLGSCPQAHRVASAVIQASKRKFFIKSPLTGAAYRLHKAACTPPNGKLATHRHRIKRTGTREIDGDGGRCFGRGGEFERDDFG